LIWDRKAEGGFPEAKVLKQRVRNHLQPGRNLGHSDTPVKNPHNLAVVTDHGQESSTETLENEIRKAGAELTSSEEKVTICEDCGPVG
jgi:hypothetical protein